MQNIDEHVAAMPTVDDCDGNRTLALKTKLNIQAQWIPNPKISGTDTLPTPADSSSRYSIVTCGSLTISPRSNLTWRACPPAAHPLW